MTEINSVEAKVSAEASESESREPESHVEYRPEEIAGPVEALLLLAEEPMSETTLAQVLDVPTTVVVACLEQLAAFYDETKRGFELRHLGGGWRYYTREEHADLIGRYVLEGQQSKLSQAALETLAVVAYQQPISRARIAAIRGVNVDGVIRTLLGRGLVEEAGQDDGSGAIVFATTDYFLERMGLTSLDQLPELAPHLPEVDELEAELGQLAAAAELPQDQPADPAEPGQPTDQDQLRGGDEDDDHEPEVGERRE